MNAPFITPVGPPTKADLLDIARDYFNHWCWQHGLQDDPPDWDEDLEAHWIAVAIASLCVEFREVARQARAA